MTHSDNTPSLPTQSVRGSCTPASTGSAHYSLFEHLHKSFTLILTDSELNEIVHIVNQHKPALSLKTLEDSLVRHGVVHRDAIDDAEGYDEGFTRDAVLNVFEDITGMVKPNARDDRP